MRRLIATRHLAIARVFVGLFLCVHYAAQIPYAAALYARGGVVPSAADNPFPVAATLFRLVDAPWVVTAFVALLAALALAHAAGLFTRTTGVLLWAGAATLFLRDQLTLNPSLSYLGLWMLAQAFAHPAPPWSLDRLRLARRGVVLPASHDHLPPDAWRVIWLAGAVGYAFSGWTKLASPSWQSGDALALILSSPLGRDHAGVQLLLALPASWLHAMTWGVLLAELGFLPLALVPRTRLFAWAALLAMHVGLLLTLDLADISVPMIAFHLLVFDPRWLGAPPETEATSAAPARSAIRV